MKAHPLRCTDHNAGLVSAGSGQDATCPRGCTVTVAELAPVTPLVVAPDGGLYVPAVLLKRVPSYFLDDAARALTSPGV